MPQAPRLLLWCRIGPKAQAECSCNQLRTSIKEYYLSWTVFLQSSTRVKTVSTHAYGLRLATISEVTTFPPRMGIIQFCLKLHSLTCAGQSSGKHFLHPSRYHMLTFQTWLTFNMAQPCRDHRRTRSLQSRDRGENSIFSRYGRVRYRRQTERSIAHSKRSSIARITQRLMYNTIIRNAPSIGMDGEIDMAPKISELGTMGYWFSAVIMFWYFVRGGYYYTVAGEGYLKGFNRGELVPALTVDVKEGHVIARRVVESIELRWMVETSTYAWNWMSIGFQIDAPE